MQKSIHSLTVLIIVLLTSCGSAEPVEFYQYTTTEANLENAVINFLFTNKNPHITWDTSSLLLIKRYNSAYKNKDWYTNEYDTIKTPHHFSDYNYLTIKENKISTNYVFELFLMPDNHVAIVLNSLWNNEGLDLRQGENVSDFSNKDSKAAKKLFENLFVNRIDTLLKLTHKKGRSIWQE